MAKQRFVNLKRGEIVEIVWEDAHGSAAWADIDETPPEVLVKSVGYFVKYYKDRGLVIAGGLPSNRESGQMVGPSFVPQGMVRSIRRLK